MNQQCIDTSSQRIEEHTFHSKALGRDMPTRVVLPQEYFTDNQRYPVLYLLHGWNGDYQNWTTLTNLIAYSASYPMIVVTPGAENSWYINAAPGRHFEDYIVSDLIAEIDACYRTIAMPHCRAIAGLSMGGYGAVLAALKHPDLFAIAGAISGAFSGPSGAEEAMPEIAESIQIAFGPPGSCLRRENDLELLLKQVEPSTLPYLYVACGTQDPLLQANRTLAAALTTQQVEYEYHEYPGGHTWEFWDSTLPALLQTVVTRIVSN